MSDKHLTKVKPPLCFFAVAQPLIDSLHAEGRQVLDERNELFAACEALLAMSGGPDGLSMAPPIDPATVRQQAAKAIARVKGGSL